MTEKQEKIIKAAMKLFAVEGYASTSTSKVAKSAGVSEGLIFRHFKNKEGLLDAILEQSQLAAKKMLSEVVMTSEPKELIKKTIELPFAIERSEYEVWRLIYALKWQTDRYDSSFQEPVKAALIHAFKKLDYLNPEAEAELIFMFIDGAATAFLLHEPDGKGDILKALKAKYYL